MLSQLEGIFWKSKSRPVVAPLCSTLQQRKIVQQLKQNADIFSKHSAVRRFLGCSNVQTIVIDDSNAEAVTR